MKYWLLSDNHDTLTGMRLAGIAGEVVEDAKQLPQALERALADEEIGIILIISGLYRANKKFVDEIRLTRSQPMIVEIPDRHDTGAVSSGMADYLREAIGINI